MNDISILYVEIQNVRSILDSVVTFNEKPGLNLLTGENLVEPRLEANGAGKSSFFDAIFWCLYGTTVRGAKIGSIVSWGKETARVLLDIRVSDKNYRILRTGPPNRIEIDGALSDQPAVDRILGLNRKRFLHSVIFGQGLQLFPDLPGPDRGELFDDVLNLGIWQQASKRATDRHSDYEKTLLVEKQNEARVLGALSQIETDEQIRERYDNWEIEHSAQLDLHAEQAAIWEKTHATEIENVVKLKDVYRIRTEAEIEQAKTKHEKWRVELVQEGLVKAEALEKLEQQLTSINDELLKLPQLRPPIQLRDNARNTANELATINANLATHKRDLSIVIDEIGRWKASICPTCHQSISKEKNDALLAKIKQTKETLESSIRDAIDKQGILQTTLNDLQPKLQEAEREYAVANQRIQELQRQKAQTAHLERQVSTEAQKIADKLQKDESPYSERVTMLAADINPYIAMQAKLEKETNFYAERLTQLRMEKNPHEVAFDIAKERRDTLNKELLEVQDKIKVWKQKLIAVEYWKQGFKRIRLFYVNQQLAALQAEVQNAISDLGLTNWQVKLATETENKSGTLKLGINIHIKSPTAEASWEAWSGGESQRLRLAMAMGLSNLIQWAAGVFYTFEVWDEPTNWLSGSGIEDLLEALRYRAEVNRRQIWIIDHRALQSASFSAIWTVQKTEEGSKIHQIYESEI